MSANLIPLLYAFAETPGMPPGVTSDHDFADTGEDRVGAQAGFRSTDLAETSSTEIDPRQSVRVDADPIEAVPTPANPTSATDEPPVPTNAQTSGSDPDIWLYRKRTVGLLRRYMRLSIEVGRLPSLLGREFFRTRVTTYRASTFEDAVIFVHDVERSLENLNECEKKVIAKVALQEYSQEEAGRLLGWGLRHTARCYVEALGRGFGSNLRNIPKAEDTRPIALRETRPRKILSRG